ncbi:MAG: glycosyltransferase family 39 protein, partial [Candidatus Brocadiales bacterium]
MKYLQGSSSHILILVMFCFLLYLPRLGTTSLLGTSELRYAQVSKEMLEDGHWVVPYFRGEVYCNKPPLFFWTVALLSKAVGEVTETTARLPSVVCAIGIVLVTYFLGKNLYGWRAGLMAALMLACFPKIHTYTREVRLDVMHTFFMTSALASFYYGYTYKQRRYLLLAGFAMGLMVLNKGPLALYFPPAIIFFYLAYCRDLRFLVSKDCLLGVFVLLITLLAWAIPAYLEGGNSYVEGFRMCNFTRFVVREKEWDVPLEYLGDVFAGAAPWSFLFPLVIYKYFSGGRSSKETTFLLIWFTIVFVFFCLSFQRRSPYIMP